MNTKLMFFIVIFFMFFNFLSYSNTENVFIDPREIVIKPKAINGYLFFMVDYNSGDFKTMVKKSLHNGTADKRLVRRGFNEINVERFLGEWEWMGSQRSGFLEISYYGESITATIINMESKQEFNVLIFPFMRRAFVPGMTVGKYKFKKLTFSICLGGSNVYNNDFVIGTELPEFTINSNTAVIYGIINLKEGEIKHSNEEKKTQKLRKYVDLIKKFKKNKDLNVVEIKSENINIGKKDENKLQNNNDKTQNEKLLILQMLKEGKITVDEAEKLLNTLK